MSFPHRMVHYFYGLLLHLALIVGAVVSPLIARADMMGALARPMEGRSMRATSTAMDADGNPLHSNWDNSNVAPGGAKVLMDVEGPGEITHMWFTFLGPEPHQWAPGGAANHQEMLLRIFWDGEERPGVEAPVGDFFANCFGRRVEVMSLPVVVEDADSYNCWWRMPFRKSARVEIVNESDKNIALLYYNIDWIQKDRIADDVPYFYAQYRQEYPVRHGEDYVVLETEGKGHYVGTVLAVRSRSPSWFGEGDEKIYIDGETTPSIQGTGTEDYFLSAWGLKTTSTPMFGTPYFDQWGIVGGHTSAYRWHISDPIVFNTSIKFTFEHWGWISSDENPDQETHSWNEREDDFSSVAFWYQTGRPTFSARAPHGRERTLPSLDRTIVWAGDFATADHHGAGRATTQTLASLYERPQLLYLTDQQEGSWIEIPFEVTEKAPWRLLLNMTTSYDFGRYRATLNGVSVGGTLDFHSEAIESREFHLLDFWPDPGPYRLRLECVGKAPASQGYRLGMESLRLRERRPRVKEWGHDKDKDWRGNPILYR